MQGALNQEQAMTEDLDSSNLQDTLDLYKYVHIRTSDLHSVARSSLSCLQGRSARGGTCRRCTGLAELFFTNHQGHRPAVWLVTALCAEASISAEAGKCSC